MKNNRQYLIVGLFVIIATTLLITIWLWFSTRNRQDYNTYLAIFHEPVNGITTNSVIQYSGVEVGRVKKIVLDSKNPRNIYVYLNILQNISISVDTYATMKSQGVTGLSYIDLTLPEKSNSTIMLIPHNSPPYPEITTVPSFLYSLSEQAQSLTDNVQGISSQVRTLLNNQNIDHVSHILSNLDKLSTKIADRSNNIQKTLILMNQVLAGIKQNSDNLNNTFSHIQSLTKALTKTTKNTNSLISMVQNNTLTSVNSVLLPNLNRTITNLNQSSYQLEQFLILLNQNPSALVRGKVPANPGPGE